jgi:hypothetical protein
MKLPVTTEPTRSATTSGQSLSKFKASMVPKPRTPHTSKAIPQALRNNTTSVQPRRIVIPRRGSKTAKILSMLQRPQGTTLKELIKATGWQAHSIRGFLSETVVGRMGLKVSSIKPESGERRYTVKS